MEPFSDLDAQLIWVIESFTHVIPVELQHPVVGGACEDRPPIADHMELASWQLDWEDTEQLEAIEIKWSGIVPFWTPGVNRYVS